MTQFNLKPVLLILGVLCVSLASAFQPSIISTSARSTSLFMSDGEGEARGGTVKWFNTMKGFGFIMPKDGTEDVFVHQTAIQTEGFRSLADGEEVEYFEEVDGEGRKKAVRVTGPGGEDVQGAPFNPSPDYDSY